MMDISSDEMLLFIDRLPYEEKEVLILLLGLGTSEPYSLQETARIINTSWEHVRHLRNRAMGKIQGWMIIRPRENRNGNATMSTEMAQKYLNAIKLLNEWAEDGKVSTTIHKLACDYK